MGDPLDEKRLEWQTFHDWECGPGWDHYIGVKGDGFLDRAIATNLSEEMAMLIVSEHNRHLSTVALPDELEVVATSWKYHDRPCVDFKFSPDPYAMERGFLTDITPLVTLSSAQSSIQRAERERDEALAEIERMTPKFVAYEYLESPAGRLEAEAEVKRLTEDNEALQKALELMWAAYEGVYNCIRRDGTKYMDDDAVAANEAARAILSGSKE